MPDRQKNETIARDAEASTRQDIIARKVAKVLVKSKVSISAMRSIFTKACKLLAVQPVPQATKGDAGGSDPSCAEKVVELLCKTPTTVDDVIQIFQKTGDHMRVDCYPPMLEAPRHCIRVPGDIYDRDLHDHLDHAHCDW